MIHYISDIAVFYARFADKMNRCIFLCDENTIQCVQEMYLDIPIIELPAGEPYKNLESCKVIWHKLIELGANRDAHLICVGGGVLGDMGAFAASCFMRGISYSLVPTSLLAMVDASIGGKTGVNFTHHKNYIGLFSEAENVFVYPWFLQTLPKEEWINGYAEMLKHGLILSKDHYSKVVNHIQSEDLPSLDLIKQSIDIKNSIVSEDKFEKNIRKKLNFGHTIGHAIETVFLNYEETVSHGRAVLLGMIGETFLSHMHADLSAENLEMVVTQMAALIKDEHISLPSTDDIIDQMQFDKKNNRSGINFTLLSEIGNSKIDFYLTEKDIAPALAFIRNHI